MVYRQSRKMKEQKRARRQGFLDVGISLFGRAGYHATTVPDVVAEAESSTGSFYFYFRNKEDFFVQILRDIGDRLSEALNEVIGEEEPGSSRMKAAVTRLFTYMAENPDEARILLVETSGLGGGPEQARRAIVQSHTKGVEQGLRAGLSPAAEAEYAILARCWVGSVYETVRYWLELPPPKRPAPYEMATTVAAYNLRGIGLETYFSGSA